MTKLKQSAPVARNDDIVLDITALTSDAQGVGRYENFAVFVPYALPKETVSAHVIKVNGNYAIAKLFGIVNPADERVEPLCPDFLRCGGCDLQHLDYQKQLDFKKQRVYDALTRIAGIENCKVRNTIGMDTPWRYRNKASFPFAEIDGAVRAGFYAVRSHRLVPVNDCIIQHPAAIGAMRAACIWANQFGIKAYDEQTQSGLLRHLVVRSTQRGDVLVALITSGVLPNKNELVSILRQNVPGVVGVVHSMNTDDTNVIFNNEFTTIWGSGKLTEEISGLKFEVAAPSFLQINHEQTEKLYDIAINSLELSGSETVFDVYCGIGTISLLLARKAKHIIGIESVPEAVRDAKTNATLNNIENVEFIAGEAEHVLPQMIDRHPQAAVIDPPRKGCDEAVLQALLDCGVQKLVYVSCNPETLARDVKILCDGGFEFVFAQPVDMFPHSAHVETVVLLSHKNS